MSSTTSIGECGSDGCNSFGGPGSSPGKNNGDDHDGGGARWVRVCGEGDVAADGDMLGFRDGRDAILVARHGGRVCATDLVCTHADADLSTGFLGPDGIRCPLHLSVFNLKDGNPQNPPAERPLRIYNVKIEDGQVYVGV